MSSTVRRWATTGFSYFGLAYYSGGVIAALQSAGGDMARTVAGETNLSSTVAQSLILAGLLVAVVWEPRRYLGCGRAVLPLLCIAGLALVSTLWSPEPMRTARRAAAFAECVLFGMFLYRSVGLERAVFRMGQVCVVMAVLSLAVFVAAPSIGRETAVGYERAMRGVFPQKNSMSECMLLGLCCYAFRLLGGWRWRWAGAVGLLGACLLLGRGASAILVAGVLAASMIWVALRGRVVLRLGFAFLVLWVASASAFALLVATEELFALAGRDLSLTGRVPLWQAILPEIGRAPILGHGYAAFWTATSPTVQMIWRYAGWEAPDAHSSLLDILLQLGLAGLALYVWLGLLFAIRLVRAGRRQFGPAPFVLAFGTTLLLIGLDEGAIGIPNAWTAFLPVILLSLARHRREAAGDRRAPAMVPA